MSAVSRLIGRLRAFIGSLLEFAAWGGSRFSGAVDVVFGAGAESSKLRVSVVLLWMTLNTATLALVAAPSPMSALVLPTAFFVVAPAVFAAINFLLVSAALLKLREDSDILQALDHERRPSFNTNPAVGHLVIVLPSVVFLVLFLAAAIQSVDAATRSLLVHTPQSQFAYFIYLLATVKALPLCGAAVTAAGWAAPGLNLPFPALEFTKSSGELVSHAIFFIGSSFLLGLVTLWLKQSRDIDLLVEQYLTTKDEAFRQFLQHRVEHASSLLKLRFLEAAVTPRGERKQRDAIKAVLKLRINLFPLEFCERFRDQRSKKVKREGLLTARQLVHGDFDSSLLRKTFDALVPVLRRSHQGSENAALLGQLAVSLLRKFPNPTETLAEPDLFFVRNRIVSVAIREGHKDNEAQLEALALGLRCTIEDMPQRFVGRITSYPKDVRAEGIRQIREKLQLDSVYGRGATARALRDAIEGRLKRTQDEDLRSSLSGLRAAVSRRLNSPLTPDPTPSPRRLFGWLPQWRAAPTDPNVDMQGLSVRSGNTLRRPV